MNTSIMKSVGTDMPARWQDLIMASGSESDAPHLVQPEGDGEQEAEEEKDPGHNRVAMGCSSSQGSSDTWGLFL